MKRKKTSRFNSFVMVMLIISFLFGFCGVGTLFGDKNEVSQTEEVSTLTANPAKVIPDKEPVIDSGNYTVKTWDEKLEEMFDNGQDFDFVGSGSASDPYKISTAEELALVSYLSNHNGVYPYINEYKEIPGYMDQTNKVVPDGYIQLEYLESTGTQYIDTGYIPTATTKICVEYMMTKGSKQATYASICGSQNQDNGTSSFTLIAYQGGTQYIAGRVGKNLSLQTSVLYEYDVKYNVEASFNKIKVNGDEFVCEAEEWETFKHPMYIFTRNTPSTSTRNECMSSFKLYSFKILDGETPIRDFVPSYNIETEEAGLYDLVNDVFYTNSGSGAFNSVKTLSISEKTFELTNDIYLNDGKLGLNETTDESGKTTYSIAYEDGGDGMLYQWTPIAHSETTDWGGGGIGLKIYGNSKIIYGMHINSTKKNVGLISGWGHFSWGPDSRGQYMEKVHMKNTLVYAPNSTNVGGLIGYPTCGKIINCSFDGIILGKSVVSPVGLLYNASISGFVNYGKIISIGDWASGIAQHLSTPITISNNINYGSVTAKNWASGIASRWINVTNCKNYGKITATNEGAYGIAGYAYGLTSDAMWRTTSSNCINYGEIFANSGAYGIGSNTYTKKCINYGKVFSNGVACGVGGSSVENSINYAAVKGNSSVGIGGSITSNCENYGEILGKTSAVGMTSAGTCNNSSNYANILSTEGSAAGLFSGNANAKNCFNYGSVKGKTNAGGLYSSISGTVEVYNCTNYADVKSETANAGGLVGVITSGKPNIIRCENVGKVKAKITSTTTYAGGLVGSITGGSTTIESCTNEGKVSGKTATGFVGQATGSCTIKNSLNNGDITSSTYEEATLSSTFGVNKVSQLTNCITSSKINGEKVNACAYVKDGYFSEQYRTGKIISSNASHTAQFQGVIDADYIKENSFVDFTPPPEDSNKMYTKLEYIESDGNQYIDTGIVINKSNFLNIEIKAEVAKTESFSSTNACGISSTAYSGSLSFGVTSTNITVGYTTNGDKNSEAVSIESLSNDSDFHTIYISNGSQKIDSTTNSKEYTSSNMVGSLSYTLFALNTNWGGIMPSCMKIKSFDIYEGKTLVRSFIPVIRNSDGMVGLYDTVEGKFYTDANGGNFIAGSKASQVPAGYTELESIKSNGSQYIDTGVLGSSDVDIEYAFSFLGANTTQYEYCPIYGCREGSINRFGNFVNLSTYKLSYLYGKIDYTQGTASLVFGEDSVSVIKQKDGEFYLNNVPIYSTTPIQAQFVSKYSILLNACNEGSKITRLALTKIYSCKIWEDGSLVRDFVPAKRNSDGMIGLYDTVEKKFYTDANGGNFEVGD